MLTAKRIEKIRKAVRPGSGPKRHLDGGDLGRNLYLQVYPGGASWVLRYARGGRERWMGLGSLADFSLKEARQRAREARQKLADGIDPLAARRAKRAEEAAREAKLITFKDAAQAYFNQHQKKWKNQKHRAQFLSTLEHYAFPKIGVLALNDVDTGSVLKVLEQKHEAGARLWDAVPETANRLRGRIEMILDWAAVRGFRSGDNPARWRGHLSNVLVGRGEGRKVQHHPALPYAEVGNFVAELRDRDGISARALEFCILTAARTGEVIGALWSEINLSAKLWTVPAGRIKGGREHRVPLSDRAVAIIKELPTEDGNDFVFIGPTAGLGLSNMAMSSVLSRMGRDNVTVHGFRSTFMDWAHEQTAFDKVTIDMSLAHVVSDKTEAAYRRSDLLDKRKRLMSEWARFCGTPSVKASDNVVQPLRPAR
jgi:integrase